VGAWTVGVLDALTPRGDARYRATTASAVQDAAVEPLTNYFVGRLKRDFRGGQSSIGAMLTATHRALGDTAFAPLLHDRAAFGGIDFEHDWNHGGWNLTGYVAGSDLSGAPGTAGAIAATQRSSAHYFQRPDAPYLHVDSTRSSLRGATAELALQRTGSLAASLDLKTVSPGFDINDLGFENRSDYHSLSSLVGYQSFRANRRFRSYAAGIDANQAWNYGGTLISNGVGAFANATLSNFWFVNLQAALGAPVESDRLTRGGPLARVPGSATASITANTDSRRPIVVQTTTTLERDSFDGGGSASSSVSVILRPASNVSVTLGPRLTELESSNQYLEMVTDPSAAATYGNRYVFARLHQTTLSGDTRVDWTFTPRLSLQLYVQPFVSAGRYSELKELLRPASSDYGVYGAGQGTIASDSTGYVVDPDGAGLARSFAIARPDFNVRSLRGNAVLRWEYRPGSALFVVWQQHRSGSAQLGDFDFRRDVGAIFREPMTNVLLVKLTYWMSS
jgi:hypothetical protein